MSIFTDKTYEQMDDLSKLIEPYESDVIEIFNNIPSEIQLTTAMVSTYGGWHDGFAELRADHVVQNFISASALKSKWNLVSWEERQAISDAFEIKLVGELDRSLEFNFDKKSQHEALPFILVKKDIDLDSLAKRSIDSIFYNNFINLKVSTVSNEALKTLIEILTPNANMTDENKSGRLYKFSRLLSEKLISSRRFRSLNAARDFAKIIDQYLETNNDALLAEIFRIHMMLEQGSPIYQVEVPNV